jgi:hypothetical protein
MTGYRAFSPLFVKSFPVLSQGFEIETEMTIHALDKNMTLATVPVGYRDRPEGSVSKLNTYSDGFKVLKTIAKLFKNYRPMPFFGLISLLFFLGSMGIFIPLLVVYIRTSLVPHGLTFIGSGFMLVVAILSFVCGLVLDTITKHNRQDFEVKLNMLQMILRLGKD